MLLTSKRRNEVSFEKIVSALGYDFNTIQYIKFKLDVNLRVISNFTNRFLIY